MVFASVACARVDRTAPLDGILVADFSRILAGPLAAQTLGDLGADVVKVEAPAGDDTRSWGPPFAPDGTATYAMAANRNKRSVVLDLRDDGDRRLARELARRADVVIANLKPGAMERFGLGYEDLAAEHPRLVYCAINGFGSGAGAELPGYDPLVQAVGGLMSVTGPEGGDPAKVGVALVDVIAGLNAAVGIMAALRERDRSGHGQMVEITLLGTVLAALANQATGYLNAGVVPRALGTRHPSIEPFATYACADGPLMICAGNDRQFAALADAIGAPGLADDPRFATNAAPGRAPRSTASDAGRRTRRRRPGDMVGAAGRSRSPRRPGPRPRGCVRPRGRRSGSTPSTTTAASGPPHRRSACTTPRRPPAGHRRGSTSTATRSAPGFAAHADGGYGRGMDGLPGQAEFEAVDAAAARRDLGALLEMLTRLGGAEEAEVVREALRSGVSADVALGEVAREVTRRLEHLLRRRALARDRVVMPPEGIEPSTFGLRVRCSAN